MAFFMALIALALMLAGLWHLHRMPKGDEPKVRGQKRRK